jgi:hypothetical protein
VERIFLEDFAVVEMLTTMGPLFAVLTCQWHKSQRKCTPAHRSRSVNSEKFKGGKFKLAVKGKGLRIWIALI